MKKTIITVALCSLIIPSMSFAAAKSLTDGSSIDANSTAVTLSPNVGLSYHSQTGNNYALTGANAKGVMCYGVESGNQGVFQQKVATNAEIGGNVVDAKDDNDASKDQYKDVSPWQPVGG